MKVLQEYKRLTKNVRVARQNLRDAKSNVTTMRVTCDWADCSEDARSCINCYSGMVMPLFAKGSFERFEITKYCPRFDCHKLCQNNDCEYQEQNWDAVAAQFAYDDARAARREFISGGLWKREK